MVRFLSIREALKILMENKVHKVVLGGYEPTMDPELKLLVEELKGNNISAWLLTNGSKLRENIASKVDGITFSIKAIDNNIHKKITGVGNESVLKNFERIAALYPEKVVAETVYDGKYVNCDEVKSIAEFISSVNRNVRFRIDPLVQRRKDLLEEVDLCIERIRKVLPNTSRIHWSGKEKPIKILYPIKAEAKC